MSAGNKGTVHIRMVRERGSDVYAISVQDKNGTVVYSGGPYNRGELTNRLKQYRGYRAVFDNKVPSAVRSDAIRVL